MGAHECTCGKAYMSILPPEPCPYHYGRTFAAPAKAWECPRCRRMNAPHSTRCDCVGPLEAGAFTANEPIRAGGTD